MRGWLWLQGLDGEGGVEAGAHVLIPAAACQTAWACYSCTLGCAWLSRGSVPGGSMYSSRGHICHSGGYRYLSLGQAVLCGAPCNLGVGHKLVDKLLATHFADDILGREEIEPRFYRTFRRKGQDAGKVWRMLLFSWYPPPHLLAFFFFLVLGIESRGVCH